MDESGPTRNIFFFLVLLAVDFVFYGFGAAVQKLNYGAIADGTQIDNEKKRKKLLRILDEPVTYINTIQVITTVSNMIMGSFFLGCMYRFLKRMFSTYTFVTQQPFALLIFLLAGIILIFLILSLGVLVPKKIAARHALSWSNFFIDPIYFIMVLLKPFTGFVTFASNLILRLLGMNPYQNTTDVTEEEIISMVNEGHEQGVLQASEAQMITNIFEFSDKEAKEIMTHRSNIVGIDGNMTLKECVDFMLDVGTNSRYPVYIDDIDHIIGIIHVKDAFKSVQNPANVQKPVKNIKNLYREAMFVPETRNIDSLFRGMQAIKNHMVIIIDEYGQTSGLVAMEDILEEIVGNIFDEFDEEEAPVQQKGLNQYEIDGLTQLEELEELLDITFKEEEFETLSGLMVSRLDHIPEESEQFDMDYEGYNFKVLEVENKVIRKVLVTKINEIQKGEE